MIVAMWPTEGHIATIATIAKGAAIPAFSADTRPRFH